MIESILGFLLGLWPPAFNRRRAARGHLAVIQVELAKCREDCVELVRGQYLAPLGRLPKEGMTAAVTWLIAEGYLRQAEYDAVVKVTWQVDQINQGLDRAANQSGDDAQRERSRVTVKASRMLSTGSGVPGKVQKAREGVNAAQYRLEHWIRNTFQRDLRAPQATSSSSPNPRRSRTKAILAIVGTFLGGVASGIATLYVTPWFEPKLELVKTGGTKFMEVSMAQAGSNIVKVLRMKTEVRNSGLSQGSIADCIVSPHSHYEYLEIFVTDVTRTPIQPFESIPVSIEFRLTVTPEMSRTYNLWKARCTDNLGKTAFNVFAAHEGPQAGPPPP